MARAVFTIVGNAVAGPIGGMIGNVIGGFVDNLLFPTKQDGPRVNDLKLQTSTLGKPIPVCFGGSGIRIAGNVIWKSEPIATTRTQSAKGGPSSSTTSWRVHVLVGVAGNEIESIVKIFANNKVIYDASSGVPVTSGVYSAVRIYLGTNDQTPDPIYESYVGVGEAPAHIGLVYVAFEDLQLADYGNRIPNLEFVVKRRTGETVASAIAYMISTVGMAETDAYYSDLGTIDLRGYVIPRTMDIHQAIQPLSFAFNFDTVDNLGSLEFISRDFLEPTLRIPLKDMAAVAQGEQPKRAIDWARALNFSLPRRAAITFFDPARDYQTNSQADVRSTGNVLNNVEAEVPVVLSVDEGRAIAARALWEPVFAQNTAKISLTQKWEEIQPGRPYFIETTAGYEECRVVTRTRGANGLIEIELRLESGALYSSPNAGAVSAIPTNDVEVVVDSIMVPMDCPIFSDVDDDTGFYIAASGPSDTWRGCDVYRSTDSGVTYNRVDSVSAGMVIGRVLTALPAAHNYGWDRANSILVEVERDIDDLDSVTELEVLNGANAAWIGRDDGSSGEIIQFATATNVYGRLWELSDLIRTRLGTEYESTLHQAVSDDQRFVLLDRGLLIRPEYGTADWNKQRHYKPVTVLQSILDATPQTFTNTGVGRRPLSPVFRDWSRSGNDITCRFFRRSRYPQPGLGNGPLPLGETIEQYEAHILSGGTSIRTITVTAETFTYTEAQQIADFGSAQASVDCEVYQVSDTYGRGRPLELTIGA